MSHQCNGDHCHLPSVQGSGEKGIKGLFPGGLWDDNGMEVSSDLLKGKMLGLYFSASWCPPCRAFSPVLADFQKKNEKDFQVVFVSFDKSEQEMREYMRGKPWPAASFQSNDRQALAYAFNANMLPTLVVLDGEGNFVTDWGRSAVSKNPQGCIEEWKRGNAGVTWFQMFKFW
eukprot:TRINITY_DN4501_c1_g1_i2.p1 TRINITY_DN4501_c1_g1~~TRINITY_DN4501_c1_g1_i2.p1  ORF type:complete len:173 (-),score=48.50 TRINITY_DN4501_c1_g1_i2:36-554(-)